MANRLFQQVVHQMKDIVDRIIGVVDEKGTIIACTELSMIGEPHEEFSLEAATGELFTASGYTLRPIGARGKPDYCVFALGEDEKAQRYASLVAISLVNIKQYFDEKHDKMNFVKNILIDNILPGDIYFKAKELHFASEMDRVVFLIHPVENYDVSIYDVLISLFPDKSKDYVININETDVVVVKELKYGTEQKELIKIGKQIADTFSSEFFVKCNVGIGTIVPNVKDLSHSYREAKTALEVGKVFDNENTVISYENLGIGRLIYQLPTTLCEMFLTEVFKNGSLDLLDAETLFTIQKFFENNLNISETSRKLFVHRNTLVYRLEKIKKITGLDIREFDHAIIFKVALMVKRYLVSTKA